MDTPTFFSWDDFSLYADGPISSLTQQVVWASNGTFQTGFVIQPSDNFSEYTDGTVSTLDGGSDWLSDAVFTVY